MIYRILQKKLLHLSDYTRTLLDQQFSFPRYDDLSKSLRKLKFERPRFWDEIGRIRSSFLFCFSFRFACLLVLFFFPIRNNDLVTTVNKAVFI